MGSRNRWYKFPGGKWHRGEKGYGHYFFDCGAKPKPVYLETVVISRQRMPGEYLAEAICKRCSVADEKRRSSK